MSLGSDFSFWDINITKFANELLTLLGDNGITLPEDITILVRGIVVLEGTLEIVSPDINLMEVFENRIRNQWFIIKSRIKNWNLF